MDIRERFEILSRLKKAAQMRYANSLRQMTARVTYLYARSVLAAVDDLDILGRLLILEGAAGVPAGTWTRLPPRRGLMRAKAALAEYEGTMDPTWTDPDTTRVILVLTNQLDSMLRTSGVSEVSGSDIIQQAMSGVGSHGLIKNKFRAIGEVAATSILTDNQSPQQVAFGGLRSWLKKYAINAITSLRRKQKEHGTEINTGPRDDADSPRNEIADPGQDDYRSLFVAPTPLGSAVRRALKQSIENDIPEHTKHTMMTWFEVLENEKLIISPGAELAEKAGYGPQNAAQVKVKKHWMAAMPIIFKKLQENRPLQQAVRTWLESRGGLSTEEELTWEDIQRDEKSFGRFRSYG